MPVILTPENEREWLDTSKDKMDLEHLLEPIPSEMIHTYFVTTKVNDPGNDSLEVLQHMGGQVELY